MFPRIRALSGLTVSLGTLRHKYWSIDVLHETNAFAQLTKTHKEKSTYRNFVVCDAQLCH